MAFVVLYSVRKRNETCKDWEMRTFGHEIEHIGGDPFIDEKMNFAYKVMRKKAGKIEET